MSSTRVASLQAQTESGDTFHFFQKMPFLWRQVGTGTAVCYQPGPRIQKLGTHALGTFQAILTEVPEE